MKTAKLLLVICLYLAFSPSFGAQSGVPNPTLDWEAMAHRIVQQMALQPGEKVLLVADPDQFREIIPHLRYEIIKSGAIDLGVQQVLSQSLLSKWDPAHVAKASEHARDAFRTMLRDIDAAVMLPGAFPTHPVYAAIQDLLKSGRGRTVHFHWMGGGSSPSAYSLPGRSLPPQQVIDSVYNRALLQTDYKVIAALQRRFEQALRRGEVRVTTPLGTDLRFRVGDRPVNLQDGDASAARARKGVTLIDREIELPCGAVRVAPLEESVEGVIAFPASQWDGRPVEGLRIRFSRGQVVEVTADSGRASVEAEMSRAGNAARALREFALGFNPELAVPEHEPWIPYYGYGAGVVRLSLGDNIELGGKVTGGYVRWNFFTDATVSVADEVWTRNGKLLSK